MGYAIYSIGHDRHGGYGVPAFCEHPDCNEEIDRGISFACGGQPFSELGCDRYFCSKHRQYKNWDEEKGQWCNHKDDCECEGAEICDRCATDKAPFDYKNEHPDWVKHVLKHESWAEWRKHNPEIVKKYKLLANNSLSIKKLWKKLLFKFHCAFNNWSCKQGLHDGLGENGSCSWCKKD